MAAKLRGPFSLQLGRLSAPGVSTPILATTVLCACGLAAEARIARAAGFSTVVGAGNRERTAALVESAARQTRCLVSFGIAGALAAELHCGDVVISTEVVSDTGRWQTEDCFRARVAGLAGGMGAAEGPVFGARRILASPEDKRRAREQTGALAVDLESDVVARIANEAGIPFVVVRTIADTVYRQLPPAALIPLAKNGTPELGRVLASILRRPRQVPALVGVARETRTALMALAEPARALCGFVATA